MDMIDGGPGGLPLAGTILCCTSIAQEERTLLGTIGAQMGATIKLDLTSDVTHLIVGSTESAKYRYVAKSRDDVKVLSPSWLEALRQIWMKGDDAFDLAALEEEHRLPTFYGLRICLTGFDDPEQRRYIQDTVNKNGAEYHGDLTKAVTHLIAASPTGKKYDHALNWRLKIVSFEWFEQSLARGMVLDEAFYNPTMPAEKRGVGAWDRRDCPPSPSIGKRAREVEQNESLNPFRRKLRRSASTRMGSQSEALWAGITAASLERPHNDDDDWTEDSIVQPNVPRENTPAMRAGDVAAHQDDIPVTEDPAEDARQSAVLPPPVSLNDGIFKGRVIFPVGFDREKTGILRNHLVEQGARFAQQHDLNIFAKEDLESGYLVVPFDRKIDLRTLPAGAGSMALVTNLWVERCLYGKRLIDPAEDILSRPLENLSINGFDGLTINSTGFVGIELLHVTKVVTLMGATYDEQLSTKISVVICRSGRPSEQKIRFASERRIPAVHVTWLWESVRTGKVQPFSTYQLNTLPPAQSVKAKTRPKEQSSADVPTARLSTEESFEMQQRKARSAKPASKSRGPQRPRTLELALSVDPTPDSTTNSATHPNTNSSELELDEGVIPAFDGHDSMPLQDISANSPRRPSTDSVPSKSISRARSSSAESLIRAEPRINKVSKQPTPESFTLAHEELSIPQDSGPQSESLPELQPEPPEEKDYSDILAQLRANRKPLPSAAEQANNRRRGRRQLGRATSVRSNQSTGESSAGALNLDESEDRDQEAVYQPSQELGWDSPGAAKAREQMIKRLGGRVTETSIRVEGIGIVRDGPSELGAGRSSRSRRTKGF